MQKLEIRAGMSWVEEQFEAIADELGSPARLADPELGESRWGTRTMEAFTQGRFSLAFYVGEERRIAPFQSSDLDLAGSGDKLTRNKLEMYIRALISSNSPAA